MNVLDQDLKYYAREQVNQGFGQQPYAEDGTAEFRRVGSDSTRLEVPNELILAIQNWLKEDKSTTLWVEGPADVPYPSSVSSTGLYVSDLLAAAEIPCITFFPRSWYSGSPSSSDHASVPQQRGLLNLLYSLIRQLINVLPLVFETSVAFDKKRLDELDGTVNSIEASMELVRDLLPFVPYPLILVIDGLQQMESVRPETRKTLEELVLLLQSQKDDGVVKLLFITDGQSQVLGRRIDFRDQLDVSRSMEEAQPGTSLRGASLLSDISLG